MFENLSARLAGVVRSVTGVGRLTADNIDDAVRSVRMALIEADVALPVIKTLIERIKSRAIGMEVAANINPGHAFIKVVHSELVSIMGGAAEPLNFNVKPPLVILLAGLQGVGKTSTAVKLGKWLQRRERKSVAVVSCDVYRPAAIEQLRVLAHAAGLEFISSDTVAKPVAIARSAMQYARSHGNDILIVDTAGRLHVDAEMMEEVSAIHDAIQAQEILFVVDSMAGQDAVNTSRAFAETLPLTGIVLTKMDGDARGGAALSAREVTGKPIKFMGTGEHSDALEVFHPERVVSRILGMGDVLSLVEEAEQKIDLRKAEKLAEKIKRGKAFNLEDMRDQMLSLRKLGGIASLLDKLPGMGDLSTSLPQAQAEQQVKQVIAIVDSMTPLERRKPEIINGSRKRRIAQGSGYQIQDVNRLLKQHKQMARTMQKLSKGGMKNLLRGFQNRLPPGSF
ncbi:MAG TPA: signal recognition particle protein [Gammaproteobacteria bacterium]|nr:signal recognition particle protein [Gammaproteobacteria bacterium]